MKIYRGDTAIADVLITDQSYRSFSIMGDDYVVLDFYLKTEIDFEKNDYCNAFGERFSLIEKPVPEMIKGILHYNIKLYNTYKELEKVKVFLYDTARDLSKSEFPFTCTPSDIVQLIVDNMNSVQGGIWSVGNVIVGEAKTITISNQSCLDLLASAASEWDTEWYVEGHTINLAKRTYQDNPIKTLSIGTGLLSVQQEALGNTSITRLYALGGTKNLPSTYGSTRLKMDVPYLEVSGADIFEDIVVFDDIYPHRLGTISSVRQTSQGIFYFTDSALDFNPNDCQIEGLAKHIIFQSGALVGYDFEVNYNAATGEFEIIQYTEPSGEVLPSATLAPSAGDKYIIYNIAMPQSYVTAAENELKEKAQAYFDKIKNDKLSFNVALDEVYFTRNGLTLQPGEEIILKHEYIEALKNGLNIRITGFNRYLNQPHRYDSVKVSDTVYSNPISRIDRKIEEVENVIERTGISNPNYPRRNWRDLSETMNLLQKAFLNFSKGITPITVQTMQLIVGDESLQFRFVNNKTNPTAVDHSFIFDKQTGKFTTPAGIIQHMTLGITDIKSFHAADEYKYWDIAAYTSPILEHEKAYYLYLKCDKNGTTGIFLLSETAIGMEQVSGYYHFLVGILNSQQDNDRSFAPLYGFTEILPGRITTDKIVSTDGKTYFDLDNSVIGGRIKFLSTSEIEEDLGLWAESTEQSIDAAKQEATEAAQLYADSKAALAETQAKAYADGIVDAEEQRAIADAQAKLQEAKNYADAKAAETNYLKQALKQDTDISGGLLLSSILATRDASGVVRSYQSGDPDANPAAFAAGVENFGTTSEKKKVEICHDGTGRIGIFVIDDLGNIKIYDPLDPTILRLMFSKNNLPVLQSMLDDNIYGGSVTNTGALGTESITILPNKITVTQSGADVHFTGNLMISGFLEKAGYHAPGYSSGKIQVTVMIVNEATLEAIYSITDGRVLDFMYESSYYNTTGIDQTIYNVDAGTYRVEIHRININADDFYAGLSGTSTLSWSFIKDIRRFEFARNGFMAFYQNNHMYFSEAGGLDVRGAMNIPGILLSGRVNMNGGFNSIWGAKVHASSTATRNSAGSYTVYHSVGHSDYSVQITPETDQRVFYVSSLGTSSFTVYFKNLSGTLADSAFAFSIHGKNYQ